MSPNWCAPTTTQPSCSTQKYPALTQTDEQQLKEVLRDYLPKLNIGERLSLEALLRDEEAFTKLQKLLELHEEVAARSEWL